MAAIETSTLQLLLETGKQLRAQELKPLPNDPERQILFADGKHTILETPRRPTKRQHIVATLADFATAYDKLLGPAPEGEAPRPTPSPIWFNQNQVVAFTDDRFRDEFIRLDLPSSDHLELMEEWAAGVTIDQPTFVRKLRHDLAGCVDPNVLRVFRSLHWQSLQNVKRVIETGKQSIDSDLVHTQQNNEAAQTDQFRIEFPLFDHEDFSTPADRFAVTATVDINCERATFLIQLLPGHYTAAVERARNLVRNALALAMPEAVLIAGTP